MAALFAAAYTRGSGRSGRSMASLRIFVMYPAGSGKTWHVSVDGDEGESFTDGLAALNAACDRARALEQMGHDVQVRQEDADGTWHIVRE